MNVLARAERELRLVAETPFPAIGLQPNETFAGQAVSFFSFFRFQNSAKLMLD